MTNLISWITRAVIFGSVIMYGALGEMITEKAGNLNLGTPGIMCIGGAFGFAGAYTYETSVANPSAFLCVVIAFLCSIIASVLAGLIYSFLTTTLRVNQNVCGLTLSIFGVGLSKFFGSYIIPVNTVSTKADLTNSVFTKSVPYLSKLGTFGEIFFSYGFMMYLVILIAVITHFVLTKTKVGLNLRAVGENPGTADAAGINVTKYKYLATCIGAAITGLGGLYYVLDYNYGTWATAVGDAIESFGWLSVALVIFATWKALNVIWGAYLFGLCYWAYQYIPTMLNIQIDNDLAKMLPYLVTIIVLVFVSLRKKKENQGPESLGLSYFREER